MSTGLHVLPASGEQAGSGYAYFVAFVAAVGGQTVVGPEFRRVTLGGGPPRVPTDPYVRVQRIRLVTARVHDERYTE